MNSAPGKDLIPEIVRSPNLNELRSFYLLRVGWRSYPIFHERMMSSSLFDDLYSELKKHPSEISSLLNHTLTILEKEDEKYILCAVFLLSCLCNCSPKEYIPSAEQLTRIEKLQPHIKDYAFIINLSSFWEVIANFAGRSNESLTEKLLFPATLSPSLPELQLKSVDTALLCPVSMQVIEEWFQAFSGNYELAFRGAMEIGEDQYWVFHCRNTDADLANQNPADHLWVHHRANSTNHLFRRRINTPGNEPLRQEIISYHFSPWEHAAF